MNSADISLRFGPVDFWWPLLAACLIGAGIWQFFCLRTRCSLKMALGLTILRVSSLMALLFFILEPTVQRSRREKFRPAVAVMVDNSKSMGIGGGTSPTRLERVKAFVASDAFQEVVDDYFPEYYVFSENASRITINEAGEIMPEGHETDLEGSLRTVEEKTPLSLGAVMVFTDGGHDTIRKGAGVWPGAGDIPLLMVGVGGETPVRDIEIVSVRSAGMAFSGQPARFTVKIRAKGFPGRTFPLLLKEKGRVLLSRDMSFTGEEETLDLELSWIPPRPGSYQFLLEVPSQAEEQIRENNRLDFSLEAVRDKIRVLLVSGRPSWDHRFLRDTIKGDPSIDLVSFIILRTASDSVNVSQNDLSLIPFPTKKIFLEELDNFDLVIFENFSYRAYFPIQYLERMRDYVKEGGSLWMLGGPSSFAEGGYVGTPLEEVLPVLLPPLPPGEGYRAEPLKPLLTPEGRSHPLLRGLSEVSAADLPFFDGYNPSGPATEDSVVLAHHPLPDGRLQPIIVLGGYGEGRTLAVLSDSLWKWNFEMAGRGRGNIFYLSFVRQAIRWSIGDSQFQPVTLQLEKDRFTPEQKLRASLRVLGKDFLPARDPELKVFLRRQDGSRQVLPVRRESEGLFTVEAAVAGTGTFSLEAQAGRNGETYGRDAAFFEVAWPLKEYRNPGLNMGALRYYSGNADEKIIRMGGHGTTARRLEKALEEAAPGYRVEFEEEKGLGDEWWAFVLILSLAGAEWLIRKRSGLD